MYVRCISTALMAVFLFLTMGKTIHAQSRDEWRESYKGEGKQPVRIEQTYHGVKPGSGNTLPKVEELKGKSGKWVTWPGFAMQPDGGSRIFLQTTVPLTYTVEEKKMRVVLKLGSAKVFLSNNRNPLVTTHFNTPLKRAYLKKRRKALELILILKVKASPNIVQTTDQDGYNYLFVDFPPGNYPKADDSSARPAYSGYSSSSPSSPEEEPKAP